MAKFNLVVLGLGNPGIKYTNSRHNIGHWLTDSISLFYKSNFAKSGSFWECSVKLKNQSLLLLKSSNYMNCNGLGLKAHLDSVGFEHSQLLVVHDEQNLPFGRTKISLDKSDGGHNGVLSVHEELGCRPPRLRIGIGSKLEHTHSLSEFVLSDFTNDELYDLRILFPKLLFSIGLILSSGFSAAMNYTNQYPLPIPS